MSALAKLKLKIVQKVAVKDATLDRRTKLLSAIDEQMKVLAAAEAGQGYTVKVSTRGKDEAGKSVTIEKTKTVRAWFFEQDAGWYVQCRYGARVLPLGADGNAAFASKLAEVKPILAAFRAAAEAGEFDPALRQAAARKAKGEVATTEQAHEQR
jgi:hypothetical protein